MGIQVEFNPDLALRNISEFKNGKREKEECIPEDLRAGQEYPFLKHGQRNYWLDGELPLLKTGGNGQLSKPLASIVILETTHFKKNEKLYTKGRYKVIEIFTDNKVHFNGINKI